jgi:hypothetical protein
LDWFFLGGIDWTPAPLSNPYALEIQKGPNAKGILDAGDLSNSNLTEGAYAVAPRAEGSWRFIVNDAPTGPLFCKTTWTSRNLERIPVSQ